MNFLRDREYVILTILAIVVIAGLSYYFGRTQSVHPAVGRSGAAPAALRQVERFPPQRFQDWTLLCAKAPQRPKRCGLVLQVVDKTRKHLVLRLVVSRGSKGHPILIALTPPNASLPEGVTLTPDGGKPTVLNFLSCGPRACEAGGPVNDDTVHGFSAASKLNVSYVTSVGRRAAYTIPVQGFASGYVAWNAAYPAPALPTPATPPSPAGNGH